MKTRFKLIHDWNAIHFHLDRIKYIKTFEIIAFLPETLTIRAIGLEVIMAPSYSGQSKFSARSDSRRQKPLRVPDLAYLERVAIWYLERYAASSAMLQRVLMRRIDRAARAELIDRESGESLVAQIIKKCQDLGYIHDQDFARNMAGRLARRGGSRRQIEAALRARGLGPDDIAEAVTHAASDAEANGENPEFVAANTLARRRRLGPYRTTPYAEDAPRTRQTTRPRIFRAGAGGFWQRNCPACH